MVTIQGLGETTATDLSAVGPGQGVAQSGQPFQAVLEKSLHTETTGPERTQTKVMDSSTASGMESQVEPQSPVSTSGQGVNQTARGTVVGTSAGIAGATRSPGVAGATIKPPDADQAGFLTAPSSRIKLKQRRDIAPRDAGATQNGAVVGVLGLPPNAEAPKSPELQKGFDLDNSGQITNPTTTPAKESDASATIQIIDPIAGATGTAAAFVSQSPAALASLGPGLDDNSNSGANQTTGPVPPPGSGPGKSAATLDLGFTGTVTLQPAQELAGGLPGGEVSGTGAAVASPGLPEEGIPLPGTFDQPGAPGNGGTNADGAPGKQNTTSRISTQEWARYRGELSTDGFRVQPQLIRNDTPQVPASGTKNKPADATASPQTGIEAVVPNRKGGESSQDRQNSTADGLRDAKSILLDPGKFPTEGGVVANATAADLPRPAAQDASLNLVSPQPHFIQPPTSQQTSNSSKELLPPEVLPNGQNAAGPEGGPVNTARLLTSPAGVEMRVTLQSDALGAVQLRAVAQAERIDASIGVERADVQSYLRNELPSLQQALNERNVRVEDINVTQNALSSGMALSSGQQSGPQSFAESRPNLPSLVPEKVVVPQAANLDLPAEIALWPGDSPRLNVRV